MSCINSQSKTWKMYLNLREESKYRECCSCRYQNNSMNRLYTHIFAGRRTRRRVENKFVKDRIDWLFFSLASSMHVWVWDWIECGGDRFLFFSSALASRLAKNKHKKGNFIDIFASMLWRYGRKLSPKSPNRNQLCVCTPNIQTIVLPFVRM